MAGTKVPVTRRALIQRINRALTKDQELLRTARGKPLRQQVGDYYVIDISRNFVVSKDVDLEELGREQGVLRAYERVVD